MKAIDWYMINALSACGIAARHGKMCNNQDWFFSIKDDGPEIINYWRNRQREVLYGK